MVNDTIADMGNPELTNAEVRGMHPKKGANWDLLVSGFTGFYLVNRLSGKGLGRLFHEHFNACKDAEYKKLDEFERCKFNKAGFARKYLEKEKINWKNCHLMDYLNPEQKERIEMVWGELDRCIEAKIEINELESKINDGKVIYIPEPDCLPTYQNGNILGEIQYYQMAIDKGFMQLNDDGRTYTWLKEIYVLAAFFGMFYIGDHLDNNGNYIKGGNAQGTKKFAKLFSVAPKSLGDARKGIDKRVYPKPCVIVDLNEMIKEARKQAEKKKQEQQM